MADREDSTACIRSTPVVNSQKLKSSLCSVQRPRGLSKSCGHLACPSKTSSKKGKKGRKNCRKTTTFRLAI